MSADSSGAERGGSTEMAPFYTRETCRSCGSTNLVPILSLGEQFVSDFVPGDLARPDGARAPLDLVLCSPNAGGCGLLQLRHTVDRDLLYRYYWYKSGINQTMRDALADVAQAAERIVALQAGDIAVDIGCNDGTLLRAYRVPALVLVGFEPAQNLIAEAEVGTSRIINDYFNFAAFERSFPGEKARVITAIAMFYDLDDPNAFVADIKHLLAEDGVFIIQMNYLLSMLRQNAFDNIGHEHLEYYSLTSLTGLLNRHALQAFDVETNDINGGSFRIYVCHPGQHPITARLRALEQEEQTLRNLSAYLEFGERIERIKAQVSGLIREETGKGKRVYVYGASTRGNTLLQYFGLDRRLITAAAERNPQKVGRRTIGTNIPIISEEQARQERPDYFLILPWAFLEEFRRREHEFLEEGGRFIVPLPEFRVISSAG